MKSLFYMFLVLAIASSGDHADPLDHYLLELWEDGWPAYDVSWALGAWG